MVTALSSQVSSQVANQVAATVPGVTPPHNGWLDLLAFLLTMGLVAVFTWLLTGRYRSQQIQEPIRISHPELSPAMPMRSEEKAASEEIELWRSRLEYLYLDVPAVDPRGPEKIEPSE